jgi:hypothetical protein
MGSKNSNFDAKNSVIKDIAMKQLFTLLAVAAVTAVGMSSCSSSRNTQATDDIYYSSGSKRPGAASSSDKDEYYSTSPSDNYVRMKAEDQQRWSYFDDYGAYDSYYAPSGVSYGMGLGYGYPSYGFGYGLGYGYGMGFGYGLGFYDSYFLWNSWYNPYFYNPYYGGGVFVVGHSGPAAIYSNIRPFNSVAYRNGLNHTVRTTNSAGRFYRPGMSTTSNYNSNLSGQGRQVNNNYYRPANNNNNGWSRPSFNNNSQPTRSYTPSSSFGSGGGGGFSRPGRH